MSGSVVWAKRGHGNNVMHLLRRTPLAAWTVYNGGTTVTADSCKAWYAALLANQNAGSTVTFYFSSQNSGGNGPDCTALGTWVGTNPLPYSLEIAPRFLMRCVRR